MAMKQLSAEAIRELAWNLRAGGRLRLNAEWSRIPTSDRATIARTLRSTFDGWRADGFRGHLTKRDGYVVCYFA